MNKHKKKLKHHNFQQSEESFQNITPTMQV